MKYSINKSEEIFNDYHHSYQRAEETSREREDDYKEAVGVTIVQNGKFAFVNRSLQEKLGCVDEHELIGKNFLSHIHQDSLHKLLILMEHSDIGNSGHPMKGKFFRLNGSTFFAEFVSFPILFKGQPADYLRIIEIYSENEFNFRRKKRL